MSAPGMRTRAWARRRATSRSWNGRSTSVGTTRSPSVRAWKEETGGLAIGYMPVYVPRELLWAQGVLPVGLLGGGDDLEIIRGDAYYQSYICHIPRSTIELGLNGSLDCLDGMLFPATCDVIRNLSGMWKMQFPDKFVRYLDVPQDFDPEIGGTFYRHELEEICRGARTLGGAAVRRRRAARSRSRSTTRTARRSRTSTTCGAASRGRCRRTSSTCCCAPAWSCRSRSTPRCCASYRSRGRGGRDRRPMDQARVLLTGSFCEQPPLGLIKTLERAGCYIVDDDFVQVHRWIRGDVPADGDPLDNLVTRLPRATRSRARSATSTTARRAQELVDRVEHSGAEGVLFCAPSFCDPALLDQPMAVAAIEKAGIPWTAFKYSENTGQFQVIREQAGTFADSIKLWSGE